jgi:hypothetical protein
MTKAFRTLDDLVQDKTNYSRQIDKIKAYSKYTSKPKLKARIEKLSIKVKGLEQAIDELKKLQVVINDLG